MHLGRHDQGGFGWGLMGSLEGGLAGWLDLVGDGLSLQVLMASAVPNLGSKRSSI
jgi:hypothetical protein